ncbi:hypothetical protein BX281_1390 [Streptomyces sp. Ag82_O1-15]|nr:hypothetical protein BX281_1390 [Streptomyces sp. Ag82_O1-15]
MVCSQPGPEWAPAGSVVQLRLGDGTGLTIHMNTAVPPDRVWRSIHSPEVSPDRGIAPVGNVTCRL